MALVNPTIALVGDNNKTLIEASNLAGVITVNGAVGTFSTIVLQGAAGTVVKNTTNNGTALPVVLTPADIVALGDGAVEVTVSTTDLTTTLIAPDGSEDFAIDTVAPTASLEITAISLDSNITDDFVTNQNTISVSGGLSALLGSGEKVQISNDAGATWSDATVAGLTWSYNDPTAWTDGIVTYLARIVDAAGNATTPVSKDVEIDTTASTVTLEITAVTDDTGQVIDDFVTSDTSLTVSGGLSSALAVGEKVQVSSDSGANWFDATTTGTTWSYADPTVRTDGTFTYEARIIDLAGNTSVPVTKNVTIDATPPTQIIDIEAISDDSNITTDFITNDTSLTVSGSLDVALGVDEKAQISVDGGTTWVDVTMLTPTTWAYTDPTARMNGTFNYLARIVDLAGNVGPGTDTQSVTIDNSAPTSVLAITAISTDSNITTDFVTNDTMLTVSGTLSTPLNSGEKVQVSSDGGATWVDATNTPTTWSYIDPTVRTNGTFTYQARIIDLAGNTTTPVSQAVTVDNTNPAQTVDITAVVDDSNVPGDFVTNDTTLTIAGTLSSALGSGEKVQVSPDGGTTWFDATTSGLNWTYIDPTTRTTSLSYQARVIDLAGNVSAVDTQLVTIDTTAPTVTVTPVGDADKTLAEATSNAGVITVNGEAGTTSIITFTGTNGSLTKQIINTGTPIPVVLTNADVTTLGQGNVEVSTSTFDNVFNLTVTPDTNDGDFRIDTTAPVGVNDPANVVEAGGVANAIAGTPIATGNVLTNDTGLDNTIVREVSGNALNVGVSINGTYGSVVIGANGTYTYTLNNNLPATQALSQNQTVTDTFSYSIADVAGNTATANLVVTVTGANDAASIFGVVTETVVEAGGLANAVAGTPTATGALIANDVDSPTTFTAVAVPTNSDNGYGTFTMTAAGVWTYTLNNTNPTVQALVPFQSLNDTFTVTSADGTPSLITIAISGRNDAPVISGDLAANVNEGGSYTLTASDLNFTDVDDNAADVIFNVSSLVNGQVRVNNVVATSFTGTQLAAGQVSFQHDASQTTTASFAVNVEDFDEDGSAPVNSTFNLAVNPVNQAPTLTGDLTAIVAEGGAYTITATDLGYNDVDDLPTGVNFNVSGLVNGVVKVNGVAATTFTPAQLTGGLVTFEHNGSETTSASFLVNVEDGNEDSSAPVNSTFNFAVTPTNDAPVLTGDLIAIVQTGGAYTLTASDIGYTDVDDVDAGVNFNVSNLVNGVVKVNGSAATTFTPAQLAGGLVTFEHNGSATTSASFKVNIEDGNEDSSTPLNSTFNFAVTPAPVANVAPLLTGDLTATVAEGATYTITAADLGYTDVDDTATGVNFNVSGLVNGVVKVNGVAATTFTPAQLTGGLVTFEHNGSETTSASFLVNVEDGNEDNSVPVNSTFNFAVTPVNDAAVITGASAGSVVEAGGVANAVVGTPTATGTLTATDVDSPATFTAVTTATNSTNAYGTYTMTAAGVWTYALNNANTTVQALSPTSAPLADSFTVTSADGTQQVINITITGANDAPVITGDLSAATTISGTYTLTSADLGFTDVDDIGTGVTFNVSNLFNGDVRVSGNPVTSFTPAQLAAGQVTFVQNGTVSTGASFSVNVEDGNEDGTAPVNSTFNFIVSPAPVANVAPLLTGDLTATVAEGATYTITAADLGYTDVDDTATGVNFNVSGLVNGVVKVNGVAATTFTPAQLTGGLVTFEHNGSETTSASFLVNVEDGNEDNSVPVNSTFNFAVTPVNDAAVITGASAGSVVEAGGVANAVVGTPTATGTLTATDVDSPATFTAVTTATNSTNAYGTYTMTAAGVWTYALNNANTTVQALSPTSAPLADSFTVTSADGTQQVINITITGANDAPVITGDLSAATTISGTYTLTSADLGFTDVDDIGTGVTFNVSNLFNGDVRVSGNPVTSFTPAQLAAGQVTFVQNGTVSTGASFSVNVEDGNEDGTAPVNSTFNFIVSPAPVANVAPLLTGDLTATVAEGATYTITAADLGYTDVDDTATGVNFNVSGLVNGVVKVNGVAATTFTPAQLTGGLVTFEHNGSETTSASFLVNVEDGNEDNSVPVNSTFNFAVTPVNDAPDAQNDTITGRVNRPITITPASLLANDTDPEGNVITGVSVQNVVNGAVAWNGTALVFTPTTNYIGPASFTYTISDGNGGFDTATVNINIGPNTAPDAVNDTITGVQNGWVAIAPSTLLSNDSDIDGDQISGVAIGNPVNGQVYFDGTNVVFIPNQGYTGPASFTYTITDGQLTDTATVTMNITAIQGTANGETLVGSNGNDVMIGLAGDDVLNAGTGNDVLNGGAGSDTLNGGAGNDIFVWSAGDTVGAGIEVDTINGANIGDKLDFRDLLQGEGNTAASLDNFLHFNFVGGNTEILISAAGTFANNNNAGANVTGTVDQKVVIAGADLTANNGLSDLQIIQNLINSNSLILD